MIIVLVFFIILAILFFVLWLRAEGQKNDEAFSFVELAIKYKRLKSEYNALIFSIESMANKSSKKKRK